MKKLLLALILSSSVFAATAIDESGAYKLNRSSKLFRDLGVGTQLSGGQWLKGQWSYAVSGGAANANLALLDHEGVAVKLPDNAIIQDCLIDVVTAPTSATSSGKIALSSNAVGDLKASAVAHTTFLADTRVACIPVGTAATAIKMSSEATLRLLVGSEALTAGKINVWVNYVVSN